MNGEDEPVAERSPVYTIERPEQIALLASPIRHVILDALAAARKPCSVSQLAKLVGRPADSLYYHLRALRRAGLVLEVERPRGADRETTYYTAAGHRMRIRYDFGSPTFRKNIVRMVTAMLRAGERDFSRAAERTAARGFGRRRDTWAGRRELRLTGKQLEALNRLIGELFDVEQAGPDVRSRRYALTLALAPVPDRQDS